MTREEHNLISYIVAIVGIGLLALLNHWGWW